MRGKGIKKSSDVIAFNAITYPPIIVFTLLCVLPFYLIVIGSFTSENAILTKGFALYIRDFSLESYMLALKNPLSVVSAYRNTFFVTIVGTFCCVLLTTMTGYVLSRPEFPWRNKLTFYFFFTMLFSGGLVPWYIMCIRYFGFKNNMHSLILPGMFSTWYMMIAKNFLKNVPIDIVESAKLDGANDFMIYYRIFIPVSKPLIATIALFAGLSYWNDWYNCMLFIQESDKITLQFFLQQLLNNTRKMLEVAAQSGIIIPKLPEQTLKMVMTIIVTGPILLLYPFLQKYFIKGLTIGAVKG